MAESYSMSSKWGAQIEGESYDIENLVTKVNATIRSPDSIFVSMINDVSVLRSRAWDKATDAAEVNQLAGRALELIQGCLQVLDGCMLLSVGTIYEFKGDQFEMTRSNPIQIRVRMPKEQLASPIEFGRLMNKAVASEDLRQALYDFKPQPSWFDLYKVWESVKRRFGGEHKVYQTLKISEKSIRQFKNTANSFRHVPSFQPIKNPISLKQGVAQARSLILDAAMGLPQAARAADAFTNGGQVTITNIIASPGGYAAMGKLEEVRQDGVVSFVETGAILS